MYNTFSSEDNFKRQFRKHEEETSCKYIILHRDKTFGAQDFQLSAEKKICWELKSYPFSGIPFQVVGTQVYECHQGQDRHVADKEKYAVSLDKNAADDRAFIKLRRRVQNTKKLDCKAVINVAHIICFPGFRIAEHSTTRCRKNASSALKLGLIRNPSSVQSETLYSARFPLLSEHLEHPLVGKTYQKKHYRSTQPLLQDRPQSSTADHISLQYEEASTYSTEDVAATGTEQPLEAKVVQHKITSHQDTEAASPHDSASSDLHQEPPLPAQSSSQKEALQRECTSQLKDITHLTYHLEDEEYLTKLSAHLQNLLLDVKAHTPHDKGLTRTFLPSKRKAEEMATLLTAEASVRNPFSGRIDQHAEDKSSELVRGRKTEM